MATEANRSRLNWKRNSGFISLNGDTLEVPFLNILSMTWTASFFGFCNIPPPESSPWPCKFKMKVKKKKKNQQTSSLIPPLAATPSWAGAAPNIFHWFLAAGLQLSPTICFNTVSCNRSAQSRGVRTHGRGVFRLKQKSILTVSFVRRLAVSGGSVFRVDQGCWTRWSDTPALH